MRGIWLGVMLAVSVGQAQAQARAPVPAIDPVALDALFADYTRTDRPGCTAGVSHNGEMLYARAFGMAELDWSVPLAPDTLMDLGSVTKQFTAFAMLLLESRGKLSMTDSVGTYLPDLPERLRALTLDQMMRHTSGLMNYESASYFGAAPPIDSMTPETAYELITRLPRPEFAPGSQFSYSGGGYLLFARIVEKVDGRPLSKFLAEEVFAPLGMTATRMTTSVDVLPRRALPYLVEGDRTRIVVGRATSIGEWGVFTNVVDLAKWLDNLRTGRVGGASVRARMTRGARLTDGTGLAYGGGLALAPFRGVPMLRHNGASPGAGAEVAVFPDRGLAVSVLCNSDGAPVWDLVDRISEQVLGIATEPVAKAVKHPGLAGRYLGPRDRLFEIVERDGTLVSSAYDGVLRESAPDRFTVAGVFGAVEVRPVARADGRVTKIALREVPVEATQELERVEAVSLDAATLAGYAGRYLSHELEAMWTVTATADGLRIVRPDRSTTLLTPIGQDRFMSNLVAVRFERDAQGRVVALVMNTRRAWNWRFTRL